MPGWDCSEEREPCRLLPGKEQDAGWAAARRFTAKTVKPRTRAISGKRALTKPLSSWSHPAA